MLNFVHASQSWPDRIQQWSGCGWLSTRRENVKCQHYHSGLGVIAVGDPAPRIASLGEAMSCCHPLL